MEIQQLQSVLENHGLIPAETVEDAKKKQSTNIYELEESLNAANARLADIEKVKLRLTAESDEAMKEVYEMYIFIFFIIKNFFTLKFTEIN